MSIPNISDLPEKEEKEEKRKKIPRTYDIYQDQVDWLDNSSLNKAKKIRELLDNFINGTTEAVIQNLRDEITKLVGENVELINNNIEFSAIIETQKSVFVAMGGKE